MSCGVGLCELNRRVIRTDNRGRGGVGLDELNCRVIGTDNRGQGVSGWMT